MAKKLVGQIFGRLTVVERAGTTIDNRGDKRAIWRCLCMCGSEKIVTTHNLTTGSCHSCGCIQTESRRANGVKNGVKNGVNFSVSNTFRSGRLLYPRLYRSYLAMHTRCLNPNNHAWHNYGGRGIKICDRWLGRCGFMQFYEDMGDRPVGHTLDRIDNNGDYTPSNCKWSTPKQQSHNSRSRKLITCNGESRLLIEWSRLTGIKRTTINARLKRGWSTNRALSIMEGGPVR